MIEEMPDIRGLADWMLQNGSGLALIAIVLVLLFIYFLKLIFKKTNEQKLEEILRLSIEIKSKIEELLGRKKT